MAIRRCLLLQPLTRQAQATSLLFTTNPSSSSSLHSLFDSVPFFPNANTSSPLLPIFTNSKPTCAFAQCSHLRYFSSTKQGDTTEEEEEEEEYSEEEDAEEDEEDYVSVTSGKRVYTAEGKEEEAAAIGYKVVGPLQKDEQVFKPYEPVFAVVQVQFANSASFRVSLFHFYFLVGNECVFFVLPQLV